MPNEDRSSLETRVSRVLDELRAFDAPSRVQTRMSRDTPDIHDSLLREGVFDEMTSSQPYLSSDADVPQTPRRWTMEEAERFMDDHDDFSWECVDVLGMDE